MSKYDSFNNGTSSSKLSAKKKFFKKSDILVFAICIVAALLVWMYASNIKEKEKESQLQAAQEGYAAMKESEEKSSQENQQ